MNLDSAKPWSPRGAACWLGPAFVALLLVLHVGLVLRLYPPSLLLRGEVPLHGDIYRYWATAYAAAQTGGLFGYDPYVMAGYPVGLWNSMGKKGFEVAHLLLPWTPLPALFYWVLILVPIAAPVVLWLGLKPFLDRKGAKPLLLLVILIFWHLETQIAYFWGFGNVFFPGTACLIPVMAGLLWALLQGRRTWLCAGLLGLGSAAIIYMHPVALVGAAVVALPVLALNAKALTSPRTWKALSLSALLAAALTVWWLIPLFQSAAECVPKPRAFLQSSWKHFVMDFLSDRGYRHRFDRTFLLHVAVVLGALGTVLSWRQRRFFSSLGMGACGCLLLAYGGSYLPVLSALQPYRFLIPATILMLGPSVVGAEWLLGVFLTAGRNVRLLGLALAAVLGPQLSGYVIDLAWTRPLGGLPPAYRLALDVVRELPPGGRVLCDDMNLGHLIPSHTGRAVIGGLSTQAFLKHRFAGMDNDGGFFGRPAGEWTAAALKEYLDAYAVEWAVLMRDEWRALADRSPAVFRRVQDVGGCRLYQIVDAKPSLAEGELADVQAGYNRIEVRALKAREVTLKLHYAPRLSADAGVKLTPAMMLDDPVPFIHATVPDGVTSFTIRAK